MPFGLRLRGDDADAVALAALAGAAAGAMQARYRVVHEEEGVVLCGDVIDSVVASALRDGGFRLEEVTETACRAAPVVDGLLAAVPLSPRVLRAVDDDVAFLCDDDASATRLCEQLVLLGRDDALVGRVSDGHPRTTVRLGAPPWWLLARVVDGCEPGVAAFIAAPSASSTTPAALYVAAGFTHPLGTRLAAALARDREIGLLGRDGVLRRFAAPWGEAPILDAIRPELPPATRAVVVPATADYTVQLRLGAASDQGDEPELFVVDGDQLARLQAFADAAPPDELDRVVLGRLADDSGRARFVVRELARPGAPRLGARLQSLLGASGYVRMPGVEGLFLPAGRRLVPLLRERALRGLLGLLPDDEGRAAAAVIVDEDSDGLRVTSLAALEAAPLSSLTSFALTERRVVYDRLFEDTVLHFPGVQLVRGARPAPERAPRVRAAATATAIPSRPRRPAPPPPTTTREEDIEPDTVLLAEEQDLQRHVLAERIEEPGTWGRLAEVKASLGRDDVVETLATALFLGASVPLKVAAAAVPESGRLLDLVTLEQPSHLQAVRLCIEVLRLLRGHDDDDLRDDILQQATRALLRESMPVPRRLQWATLFAIAKHLRDPIGLTRAREAVLGALNTRGLSEVLDLPRFVRTSLAMAGLDAANASSQGQVRGELVALVERSLRRLVPDPETWSDGRGALLKVIFADGLARVGGGARPILAALEEELPGHDVPVQVLLRLYAARVGFVLTRGDVVDDEAWRAEVRQQLAAVERPEDRRVAEWLIKRSTWLRHEAGPEVPAGLRPSLARVVDGAWRSFEDGAPVDVTGAIKDARLVPGTYDFEVAAGLERLLGLALRTGREDVIAESARAAREAASSVRILAHRARLLGATLRAAATIGDTEVVEFCLDDVTAVATDQHVPSVRDLLAAIRPALQALRRVGASDAAHRLLQAFVPLTTTSGRETGPLSAALAEGWLQLGDGEAAAAMLDRALERVWAQRTPHIDRYEAGVAVVAALAHWPTDERARLVEQFVERLGMFTDTFTTGRYFPTHQILLAERIVDTLVDERTARSDALQAWLDEDEARVRRRVLQDWRAVVG